MGDKSGRNRYQGYWPQTETSNPVGFSAASLGTCTPPPNPPLPRAVANPMSIDSASAFSKSSGNRTGIRIMTSTVS